VIAFDRGDDRVIRGSFDEDEVGLLTTLATQVSGLLETLGVADGTEPLPGLVIGGAAQAPDDVALARLLPNAYSDDELASEFRQLTERGLATRKVANALVLIQTAGPETALDESQALAWMRSITDIRLVIAARLGIETDDSEPEYTDESEAMLAVYDWLAGVQDSLVRAVDS
jgi:hypothetical protein